MTDYRFYPAGIFSSEPIRTEPRDYVDIIELGRHYPLEAILWAACGKDPGFNPPSLLKFPVDFPREPILPGQKGVIKVGYNTNIIGGFSKSISVTSNASNNTVNLIVKGNVIQKQ